MLRVVWAIYIAAYAALQPGKNGKIQARLAAYWAIANAVLAASQAEFLKFGLFYAKTAVSLAFNWDVQVDDN